MEPQSPALTWDEWQAKLSLVLRKQLYRLERQKRDELLGAFLLIWEAKEFSKPAR
jgi:hypothetical protein